MTVLLEFEGTGEKGVDVIGLMDFNAAGKGLAGVLLEHRFGIEQVHLAGAAILDELDDGLGFGGEVLAVEKAGEGERAEAQCAAFKELAAG